MSPKLTTPPKVPIVQPGPAKSAPAKKIKLELNSKNLRLLMLVGLAALIIAFFLVTYFGLSVLSSKSKNMVSLKVQSQTANNELLNLEQSKRDVEKYSYFKDVAKTVIPSDKDQAESVLEIFQMANASGLTIQSITFPTSTLGLRTLTTTTTTQDATSASAQNAITQATPVAGIPGLYSLALTITPEIGPNVPANQQITYPKMLDFLSRIENNRHTAQITQVNVQQATNGQGLSFNLTINIFIKP